MLIKYQKRCCVCELSGVLGITQPSVSKHLKKLKQVGLIAAKQDGFWTNYILVKQYHGAIRNILRVLMTHLAQTPLFLADVKHLKSLDRAQLCKR